MDTKELRNQAGALLDQAQTAMDQGEMDTFRRLVDEAQVTMTKADEIDAAASQVRKLRGEFNQPLNAVPVTSNDVAIHNAMDTTARTKSDYKPASWVKGLPAMAQPLWVQEQMGDNVKDEARFMTDAFIKWFRSPSEDMFWKTASPDEIKAMQEDTDAEGGFFVPEQFLAQVIHDTGVPGSQLRPLCTVIRVASKDGYIPTLASATWAAIAEEAAPTESTPVAVSYTHLTLPTNREV